MALRKRSFTEMVRDGISYLTENTGVTFFGNGGIAKALVETMALEVTRLRDFASTHYENRFLSTASGVFLDLFGEMLGIPRIQQTRAAVDLEDQILRFYVRSGTLASRLPDPNDNSRGLIPSGTTISTEDGTVQFVLPVAVSFPKNAKQVYVGALAQSTGKTANVGANQLTAHSLASTDVLVTNDSSIVTGTDLEPDDEYRYRLSKAMTTQASANATAVQVAAGTARGVVDAEILEFARGAGTFDVLLVPKGNRLSKTTLDETLRSIEQVTAFGVSPQVREPFYVPFKVTIQLRFRSGTEEGRKAVLRDRVQQAVLAYLGDIRIGGELVINQLRAAVLGVDQQIEDLRIARLCIDRRPRSIRNHQLRRDEIFVPDDHSEAIEVL